MTTYEIAMWFWLSLFGVTGASPLVAAAVYKLAEMASSMPHSFAHGA